MQLDPSIILAGKTPDIGNALAGGIQSGIALRDARYQGQYRNALAQHGAGAVAGDQTARNALAGFDPTMVQGLFQTDLAMDQTRLGMDQTRLSMQETEQRMQLARETGAREAQRYADELTAAQAAQAAEEYRRQLQPLMLAQTPEELARAAQAVGIDSALIPWEDKDFIFAQEIGAAEVLELRAKQQDLQPQAPAVPAAFQSLEMRAEAAGLQPGTSEYQSFMLNGGEMPQHMTVYGPDGRPIMQQGSGGGGVGGAIPERQSQIQLFGTMMDITAPILNKFEETYAPGNAVDAAARAMPVVGNYLQTEIGQQYQAAMNAWAEGALRLATGAAAIPSEVERTMRTYFAQPGDTAATVALKRQLRGAYLQSLTNASGGGFQSGGNALPPDPLEFAEQAGVAAPADGAANSPTEESPAAQAVDLTPENIATMPADALAAALSESGLEGLSEEALLAIEQRAAGGK